jgi:hypothetical protein
MTSTETNLICPECGRAFTRAAALGAHRRQKHGVVSPRHNALPVSRKTAVVRIRNGQPAKAEGVDRDKLLRMVFPNGVPPRQDVLNDVTAWLDQAERLARA